MCRNCQYWQCVKIVNIDSVEIVNIGSVCVHANGKHQSTAGVETVKIDALLETKLRMIGQHPDTLHIDYVHHGQQDIDLAIQC